MSLLVTMMYNTNQALRKLGLRKVADGYDDFVAKATLNKWTPSQLLDALAQQEVEDRTKRSVDRKLSSSHIGRFKHIADFDWAWPRRIDRSAVERVLNLSFMEKAENVILVAGQGLGKTMIAKNITLNAINAGRSSLFVSASSLINDLRKYESVTELNARLKYYYRPSLLIIDELGYISYDSRSADLLYHLISLRYESKSVVLTTSLPFAQWNTVFPSAACAGGLIDRLTHHCEIIPIEGDSYRRKEAETARKERHHGT